MADRITYGTSYHLAAPGGIGMHINSKHFSGVEHHMTVHCVNSCS